MIKREGEKVKGSREKEGEKGGERERQVRKEEWGRERGLERRKIEIRGGG